MCISQSMVGQEEWDKFKLEDDNYPIMDLTDKTKRKQFQNGLVLKDDKLVLLA